MARLFDDASSEYLHVESAIGTMPFAMVCWFYSDNNGSAAYQYIMHQANSATANNQNGIILNYSAGGNVGAISYHGGLVQASSTKQFTPNTWHHVAGLWVTSSERRCLMDGGNKGTNTDRQTPTGLNRTSIGRAGDSTPGYYLSGAVAEAAIYDLSGYPGATDALKADAFEATVVPALAKGYSPLLFPLGLLGYWPLVGDDRDLWRGVTMTAYNTPSITAHPRVLYPSSPYVIPAPGSSVSGVPRHFMYYQRRRRAV